MLDADVEDKLIDLLKVDLANGRAKVKDEAEQKAQAEAALANAKTAQSVLQDLAKTVQEQAHERIANVVTTCLRTVFDDPYTFKINFERKRGRTEAKLVFERRGLEIDPLTASGGGVIDVAAFALRVSCLMLRRPKLSRIIVLDEAFKFVSASYRPRIQQMLEQLTEELGLQIIQVTHIPELEIGQIIRL